MLRFLKARRRSLDLRGLGSRSSGKENGNYYIGFRVIIGIMENKMETTIMGYMGIIVGLQSYLNL